MLHVAFVCSLLVDWQQWRKVECNDSNEIEISKLRPWCSDPHAVDFGDGVAGITVHNWSETYSCQPYRCFAPKTIDGLLHILHIANESGKHVKVIGSGMSPSDIGCTDDLLVNEDTGVIHVEGGVTLEMLNDVLPRYGLAFPNLSSISGQSIAGAISTGTHGTGVNFGPLSTHVVGLTIATANGQLITCDSKNRHDIFKAACCGLGAIGVIVRVTIQCVPMFDLSVEEIPIGLEDLVNDTENIATSADHVRFWWFPHTGKALLWRAQRVSPASETIPTLWERVMTLNAKFRACFCHHILELLLWLASFSRSIIVPSLNTAVFRVLFDRVRRTRGRSDIMFNFDCLFKQHVNEWAIPRANLKEALLSVRDFIDKKKLSADFPVEVRFVAADDAFLSPCYKVDSCYIGVITYRPYSKHVPYEQYWSGFERLMYEYGGRPHWAKAHGLDHEAIQNIYPAFDEFVAIRKEVDPNDMFGNAYLNRCLGN